MAKHPDSRKISRLFRARDRFSGNENYRQDLLNSQQQPALTLGNNVRFWRFLGFSTAAVVVYFSLNPAYPFKQSVALIPFSDTAVHLLSFALVTICFCLSTPHKLLQLAMCCGLMMLAVVLEILQSVIYAFELEAGDIVANMAGIVVGYLVANRIRRH